MPLKVIIAGGGPVGLTAALALSRANIPFTLLEKHSSVVTKAGSDLVLAPIGLRVLSQLGLYEDLAAASSPLDVIQRSDYNGRSLGDFNVFLHLKDFFGKAPRVLRRYDLSRIIYNGLPAEQHGQILCNKEIVDVAPTGAGVEVTCADGSTYTGDLIIGADGVHSAVRAQLAKLAGDAEDEDEAVFPTAYQCLWVRFPNTMKPGLTFETHGNGAATQMFTSPEHAVAGVYERLDKPTRKRLQFTQQDEAAMAARLAHIPLCSDGSVTLGDAYSRKMNSGIVALEEGVLPRWSWGGRIVLAGDAAHKFSPITGAGCNNGIIDVVVLVNKLHALADGADGEGLNAAFVAYQRMRESEVTTQCNAAAQVTANASWENTIRRIIDTHVISSALLQRVLLKWSAGSIAKTPCFEFLPADRHVVGSVKWQTAPSVSV